MNKRIIPVAASVLGGITLGWLVKKRVSTDKQLEGQKAVMDRLKNFERKLYHDGLKRANEIKAIKKEVDKRL